MKTLFAILAFTVFMFSGCKKDQPGKDEVLITNFSFSPSSLTVSAGTTVTWKNQDAATHTVTSNTGVFDSGDMGTNTTFTWTFTTVGSYPYHCKFHSGMTGTIIVN